MSREFKVGDVAVVRGDVCIRLHNGLWEHGRGDRFAYNEPSARPLVVIDPEDTEAVERLADAWRAADSAELGETPMSLAAYRLQAALREFADPKPPKPDEPTGLGAVVRDANNELWIRTCHPCDDCLNKPWQRGPVHRNWQIVDAIEVLTDGYDQGSGEPLADWERDLLRGQS